MAQPNSALARTLPDRKPVATPPGPARRAPRRSSGATIVRRHAPGLNRPLTVIATALIAVNAIGAPYYVLPLEERVRSPLHAWFRPSGYVGQPAGILAILIFLFLWAYPFRKKYKWLAWTGAMGRWLDVHVTLALALPLLLAIHAAWRFDGVIGLGFAAMMVVWLSGIVGRYLYARIPRSRSGIELSIDEVAAERKGLLVRVAEVTGSSVEEIEALLHTDPTPYADMGILKTLWHMAKDDMTRRRVERELRRRWSTSAIDRTTLRRAMELASREMALTQQSRMLGATQRIFRYWHVAHRPFALTALLAVLIHVAVVIAVGMTWFW